jgi:hypothetical protein
MCGHASGRAAGALEQMKAGQPLNGIAPLE